MTKENKHTGLPWGIVNSNDKLLKALADAEGVLTAHNRSPAWQEERERCLLNLRTILIQQDFWPQLPVRVEYLKGKV